MSEKNRQTSNKEDSAGGVQASCTSCLWTVTVMANVVPSRLILHLLSRYPRHLASLAPSASPLASKCL